MTSDSPESLLPAGALPLIALCHEYCQLLESADPDESSFTSRVIGLLARIYITALDLKDNDEIEPGSFSQALDEDAYNAVAASLARIFGEHDTYLDTFSQDMKYSDTPITSSVSESLADLYQVFFNFTDTVRTLPTELIPEALAELKAEFDDFWSETLCNALRALNFQRVHLG